MTIRVTVVPDIIEKLIVGQVYLSRIMDPKEVQPHWVIFLGMIDDICYFGCCTSKCSKVEARRVRAKCAEETVIPIPHNGGCAIVNLIEPTVIDCNNILERKKDNINQLIDDNDFEEVCMIEERIFISIKQGITLSRKAKRNLPIHWMEGNSSYSYIHDLI